MTTIHPSAEVEPGVTMGTGVTVWQLAHIREHANLGDDCVIGRGAYVGSGVQIGPRSKIQNYALVYEPAELGAGVFIGPGAVLTNDRHPRAVNPGMSRKSQADWNPVGVVIGEGASVGARAVCVAPVTIGSWALVAAGAVVIRDVPSFALVAGNPARRIGWVGRSGEPLTQDSEVWRCPATGATYIEEGELLIEQPEERA